MLGARAAGGELDVEHHRPPANAARKRRIFPHHKWPNTGKTTRQVPLYVRLPRDSIKQESISCPSCFHWRNGLTQSWIDRARVGASLNGGTVVGSQYGRCSAGLCEYSDCCDLSQSIAKGAPKHTTYWIRRTSLVTGSVPGVTLSATSWARIEKTCLVFSAPLSGTQ